MSMTIREELDALWEEDEEIGKLKAELEGLKADVRDLANCVIRLKTQLEDRGSYQGSKIGQGLPYTVPMGDLGYYDPITGTFWQS